MTRREYILYADESVEKGARFSNFLGGLLVSSRDRDAVVSALEAEKERLNLHGEVKWQKVTLNYLDKYLDLSSLFFQFVRDRKVRLRITFTDNTNIPRRLVKLNFSQRYLQLYLLFIEHAFDIEHRLPNEGAARLRLLLDELPVSIADKRVFRQQVYRLNTRPAFTKGGILVLPGAVGEIDSQDHVLLQCLDIVLGAMQARINADVSDASKPLGKRSVAKQQLSAHILTLVKSIHPEFHVDVTTPVAADQRWLNPYRHRLFGPDDIVIDPFS